jgi:multiple sugar transport system permease protein
MAHAVAQETSAGPVWGHTLPSSQRRRELVLAYLLLIPAVALTIGLLAYPVAWEIWRSFTGSSVTHPEPVFVGFRNYAALTQDPEFWRSTANTAVYVILTAALKLALGVGIALLLAGPFPGRPLVFLAVFLPSAYPASVALIGWYWFLIPPIHASYSHALASAQFVVDRHLGVGAWGFLSVGALNVWRGSTFTGIFLLAALNSIPQDLFDYAALEVRPGWRRFWLVLVPLLRPFLALAAFLSFVTAVTDLGNVWFSSGQRIVYPIVWTQAMRDALIGGAWGQASAAVLILLPALVALLVVCFRLFEPLEDDPL